MTSENTTYEQSIAHWAAQYRHSHGRKPSDVTVYNKARSLHRLNRSAQQLFPGNTSALVEVLRDRKSFLELKALVSPEVSQGTFRNYLLALMDLESYLIETGQLPESVIERTDLPAPNEAPPISIYTETEMQNLVAASWMGGYRWAAFVHFLAFTGRRVGEALSLRFDQLVEDRQGFYFVLPTTKNHQQNFVPVSSEYADLFLHGEGLEELKADCMGRKYKRDPQVFLFPWDYVSAHGRFSRMCSKMRVENRGFHNFRHTVITNRLASGVPLQAVAALAGHANPTQTATRYNHATALNYRRFLSQDAGQSRE